MDNIIPIPQPGAPLPAADVPQSAPDLIPAGFWIRFGAYMIDGILVTLVQVLVLTALVLLGAPMSLSRLAGAFLGIGYFIWMPVAFHGQTVGKMAAGIAIVRMDGSPLTYMRCLGRWAGYLLSGVLAGLGFVAAAFSDKKRALHDHLADTRVIYIQEVGAPRKTLIILAGIIPAALGLAAALALPKFNEMIDKAKEETRQGNIRAMRAALSGYAAEHQGQYPGDLSALVPKYIAAIPALELASHPEAAGTQPYDASVCLGKDIDRSKIQDTGKWGYVSDLKAACYGTLFVDCTHMDSAQKPWASY